LIAEGLAAGLTAGAEINLLPLLYFKANRRCGAAAVAAVTERQIGGLPAGTAEIDAGLQGDADWHAGSGAGWVHRTVLLNQPSKVAAIFSLFHRIESRNYNNMLQKVPGQFTEYYGKG